MIYKWWHTFIRRRTQPIPENSAALWQKRLSLAYGFFAWNAFGFLLYSIYKGKADWAQYYGLKSDEDVNMSPGQSWANALGIKNAKVIRISGLTKVDEYDIVDSKVRTIKENGHNKEDLHEIV